MFVSSIQHFPETKENNTQAGIFQNLISNLRSRQGNSSAQKHTYLPQFPHFIAEETGSSVVFAQRAAVVIAICLV